MKHVSITVFGKVQGVFFRASARDVAEGLSLTGFAKNQPDGSVYIEIEGDAEKLEQFMVWCKQGPPRAEVDTINSIEGDLKNFSKFEIKR